ncbi:MAG: hypothetical protein M1479_10755 [Actinobacteria bacterium]|nr:hypothetical protein [Cyanobacteriota bacterium]MCL5772728.1 hypothetical protein [Actinomycetota bacterium]
MKKKLSFINKTGIILSGAFVLVSIVSYLISGKKNFNNFISIIIAAAIAIALFYISIFIYKILFTKDPSTAIKIIIFSFLAKIIAIALIFFLFIKFSHINLIYFFISFVVFFTLLLNIEIYMIYRKVLFKK